jgi:hypothetical protein
MSSAMPPSTAASLQPLRCSIFDAVQRVLGIFTAATSLPLLPCGHFEAVQRSL